MQYQIEIDPASLVHDGVQYEPVAFREPKRDERFVGTVGTLCEASSHCTQPRLIVRPVWQWPEHLGGAAIAMDANGGVFWYERQPSKNDHGRFYGGGVLVSVNALAIAFPSFTPPPLKPGEIVMNPKYKPANESE